MFYINLSTQYIHVFDNQKFRKLKYRPDILSTVTSAHRHYGLSQFTWKLKNTDFHSLCHSTRMTSFVFGKRLTSSIDSKVYSYAKKEQNTFCRILRVQVVPFFRAFDPHETTDRYCSFVNRRHDLLTGAYSNSLFLRNMFWEQVGKVFRLYVFSFFFLFSFNPDGLVPFWRTHNKWHHRSMEIECKCFRVLMRFWSNFLSYHVMHPVDRVEEVIQVVRLGI